MTLEKQAGGTKITQPNSEAIKVSEGGGAARPIGVIIFLGGALLIWSAYENIADLTFIVGVLLALFGAAIATQRQTMTLDRQKGIWASGGDVFFVISFKSHGLLQDLGPVRISRWESNPSENNRGAPIITHPVSIEARKTGGGQEDLRFGQYRSLEEAHEISTLLAEFVDRSVHDDSNKES